MINFVCYDEFGNLTAWGTGQEENLALFAMPGTTAIEGLGTDQTHYVLNGILTLYATPKPTKPDYPCRFDNVTMTWVDLRTEAYLLNTNRYKRNTLLTECDWTQLPDVPIATKEAWAVYRQALRDITDQPDQRNVTWPVAPV